MNAKRLMTSFIVVVVATYVVAPAYAQTGFVKFSGNPVLTIGAPGSWDFDSVARPYVIFDGSTYRMWYGRACSSPCGESVGYATSADGIAWTKHLGNPVLTPGESWDSGDVQVGSVLYDGSTYRMWYMGTTGFQENHKIGLATSTDGVSWTRHPNNPVISSPSWATAYSDPYVVLKDGIYWMYFIGFAQCGVTDGLVHWCVGLATSTDGVNWALYPTPILLPGPAGSWDSANLLRPVALFDGMKWHMWYTGQPHMGGLPGESWSIGYATSQDGISWTRFPQNPILTPSPGSWDSVNLLTGSVIRDMSGFKMWYSGSDSIEGCGSYCHHRIGFALEMVLKRVSIDVKPSSSLNPINPSSSGTTPVALLSALDFDAPNLVDRSSLTFGGTGSETSLVFCSPGPEDVNGDALADLICHFDNQRTGFVAGDTVGILRGHLLDGTLIEGTDSVRTK